MTTVKYLIAQVSIVTFIGGGKRVYKARLIAPAMPSGMRHAKGQLADGFGAMGIAFRA